MLCGCAANGHNLKRSNINLTTIYRTEVVTDAQQFAIGLAWEAKTHDFNFIASGTVGCRIVDDQGVAVTIRREVAINSLWIQPFILDRFLTHLVQAILEVGL